MFTTPRLTAETDRDAWLRAMLEFERSLASAHAACGLIPESAADEIARHCVVEQFDAASIAERGVTSATPVIPLVRELTALVDESAAPYVHKGATSQDVVDTAAMLISRRALEIILDDLRAARERCRRLALEHRHTPMIGRSLLQQALPTTFGRRCASWLTALREAADGLQRVHRDRLAVQFGGPVGTLASLDEHGTRVLTELAGELSLVEPVLPWHTDRTRIGELAGALGAVAGTLGKIGLDIKLHAQTEVGELVEGASGGSSAMPHKRNPAGSVLMTAATQRVPALVSTLLSAMPQEHERAAGAWQAEWEPLIECLRLVGAAAERTRTVLNGLEVRADAMAANLQLTDGMVMAESATRPLAVAFGRDAAHELVTRLCRQAAQRRTSLREELLGDERVRRVLSEDDVRSATDPSDYLGSADAFLERALAREKGNDGCPSIT